MTAKWWDVSWNPFSGCTPVSEGCLNCYAQRMAGRHLAATRCPGCLGHGHFGDGHGSCSQCHGWGNVGFTPTFHPDRLDVPLHWKRPRRVFVCSMSDPFHEAFSDEERDRVIERVARCSQHTFLVLTKRPEVMREYMGLGHPTKSFIAGQPWPLPNLWLGVTAENQQRADERIPVLLDTPAAVRWVSYEPALGPVNYGEYLPWHRDERQPGLDWIVTGGETGPGARPMPPEWALSVFRQCKAAGVPFFWKQAGTHLERHIAKGEVDLPDGYGTMAFTRELPEVSP